MWWWGPVGLSQTRPIPRSPDGDEKGLCVFQVPRVINFYCADSTIDITTYHIMTLGNWNGLGWLVWSSGWVVDRPTQLFYIWIFICCVFV